MRILKMLRNIFDNENAYATMLCTLFTILGGFYTWMICLSGGLYILFEVLEAVLYTNIPPEPVTVIRQYSLQS